jgi:hypothetical protein
VYHLALSTLHHPVHHLAVSALHHTGCNLALSTLHDTVHHLAVSALHHTVYHLALSTLHDTVHHLAVSALHYTMFHLAVSLGWKNKDFLVQRIKIAPPSKLTSMWLRQITYQSTTFLIHKMRTSNSPMLRGCYEN